MVVAEVSGRGGEVALPASDAAFAAESPVRLAAPLVDTYNIPDLTSGVKSACRIRTAAAQPPSNSTYAFRRPVMANDVSPPPRQAQTPPATVTNTPPPFTTQANTINEPMKTTHATDETTPHTPTAAAATQKHQPTPHAQRPTQGASLMPENKNNPQQRTKKKHNTPPGGTRNQHDRSLTARLANCADECERVRTPSRSHSLGS